MTTVSQGITLKGSAELVADFFCKFFAGVYGVHVYQANVAHFEHAVRGR